MDRHNGLTPLHVTCRVNGQREIWKKNDDWDGGERAGEKEKRDAHNEAHMRLSTLIYIHTYGPLPFSSSLPLSIL